jgi:putative cell wall-binding protein
MALVATGADFPDALSGGPAAARNDAPILLVRPDGVPAAVAAELTRLQPQRIIVLGGPGVVSEGVLAQLNAMAPGGAIRIAGANRYATSAAIASAFWLATRAAFVATGQNFPDALAAASPAARVDAPMLLVGSGVPAPIDAELRRLMPFRLYVLGGTGVVSDGVMAQVRGALGLP